MINFYNQVPSIYVNASRDFQYLSWLINIVLNSVKHNVDDIYSLPSNNIDPRLAELLAMTLGFKIKRNYDQKQLLALVSIIPSILKYKGTDKAIVMAMDALVTASGAVGSGSVEIKGSVLEVTIPKELVDTTLFIDLLDYILPAGMTCRIIKKNQTYVKADHTLVDYFDSVKQGYVGVLRWRDPAEYVTNDGELQSADDSIIGLFLDGQIEAKEFSANFGTDDSINVGLLSNAILPTEVSNLVDDADPNHFALMSSDAYELYDSGGNQLFETHNS